MASDPHDDEDAFRWEGDDSPTRPPRPDRTGTALPDGWRAVGKGSEAAPAERDTAPDTTAPDAPESRDEDSTPGSLGNVALVSLGLLGGIYLLYTVGWLLGSSRLSAATSFWLEPAAVVPALWVAVAAPALWFGGVLLLTRASAGWVRFAWLVVGAFLLVPWPFVIGV
ncbi:DNA polymerase III subunit gamma/tau [Microbacterium oleivorans]|uniref:DNA polymerase III subunit gamma/tau n=1 Tax=Microbacterium oleivorans TaxID=273677 RepID=UPI00203BBA3E|nr:DNA polymerase III subunit gamma/tau [Microbacterium oleivorans]MCM3696873.1 DNA polymerase III subunit gamma/tau [Microbacterium oleivorans]